MNAGGQVEVWDPAVRVFHWLLVAAFFVAYFTGENVPPLHEWMGYAVLALVAFRVVWGFVGPEHARFADFVRGPGAVLANLRDVLLLRARRYLGHSPAGGAMVMLLLVMLAATTVTGIIGHEQMEGARPSATNVQERNGDENEGRKAHAEEGPIAELHEVLANVTLALVLLHVAGVVLASFTHRENLIASMFTGRKRA